LVTYPDPELKLWPFGGITELFDHEFFIQLVKDFSRPTVYCIEYFFLCVCKMDIANAAPEWRNLVVMKPFGQTGLLKG